MLHGTSKACCYTALLKLVAIRHLKAHCYTTLLQSLLLHGNIFHKISNCLQKPKYYLGNYLQNPNIILATIYKSRMLFWQLFTKNPNYFGNFILASSIKKKRKKIQNYWANNYFTKAQMLFGKRIILCLKPKTILWQKHILIYKKPQTYGKYKLLMTYYPSGPQTCLGYSMKDFGPNLFICRLTCDPTGRAPSSN